jgi:hypothetical protein
MAQVPMTDQSGVAVPARRRLLGLELSLLSIKRGVLFFWTLWMLIVFTTNVFDGLKAMGVLPDGWTFASGNYGFMLEVTKVHQTPATIVALLFLGVIIWEGLSAVLLWRAFNSFRGIARSDLGDLYAAFAVSIALWAGFIIADEIFFAYDVEATHLRLFTAYLVSLLAIRLLPDE